jgi:regulator of replication initiation timing
MSDRIDVKQELKKVKAIISELKEKNIALKDEVDSLYGVLGEMKEADVKDWTPLLKKIRVVAAASSSVMSKNKADA